MHWSVVASKILTKVLNLMPYILLNISGLNDGEYFALTAPTVQ